MTYKEIWNLTYDRLVDLLPQATEKELTLLTDVEAERYYEGYVVDQIEKGKAKVKYG